MEPAKLDQPVQQKNLNTVTDISLNISNYNNNYSSGGSISGGSISSGSSSRCSSLNFSYVTLIICCNMSPNSE